MLDLVLRVGTALWVYYSSVWLDTVVLYTLTCNVVQILFVKQFIGLLNLR